MAQMQLRFNTRNQLVDALEARRKWAEQHDAALARDHRKNEDEALQKYRARCRELGRLSLVRMKDELESMDRYDMWIDLPSCPMSAVTLLDEALAALAITKQEKFTLNGDHKDVIYRAHWLLTHSDGERKATVCA